MRPATWTFTVGLGISTKQPVADNVWSRAWSGRPVWVIGARGFIGAHVAAALNACGAQVTRVVRPGSPREPGDLELDLRDTAALALALKTQRPATVFNLAGYGVCSGQRDPDSARALNHLLPLALGQGLRQSPPPSGWSGLRLVHAGSAAEYGSASGDLNEQTPPKPDTLYGETKLKGTLAVVKAALGGLPAVSARLFNVYGPGEQAGKLIPGLIEAASGAGQIPLSPGLQLRDFIYVADVAEGLLRLGALPEVPGGVVNLATGALTSVAKVVRLCAAALGLPSERLAFGALPVRADEMDHLPVNIERLRGALGWTPPTGVEAGVALTVAAGGRCG